MTSPAAIRKVERTAGAFAVALAARDAAIREARAAGASLRDIADAAGVSHETIRRIVEASS